MMNRCSRRGIDLGFVAVLMGGGGLLVAETATPAATGQLTFEKDIRPILKANCFQCHGEGEKLKGDLDVRLRHFIAKGGESGAALVPGKPEQSLLFKQVRDGEMPKGDKKLTKQQTELIRQWIAAGAKTARPEPKELGRSEERRVGKECRS